MADAASPRPAAAPARGPGPDTGLLRGAGPAEAAATAALPRSSPRAGSAEVPGREPEVSFQPRQPQFIAIRLFDTGKVFLP